MFADVIEFHTLAVPSGIPAYQVSEIYFLYINPYHNLIIRTFLSLLYLPVHYFYWSMFLCQSLRNFHPMILLSDKQIT